jgi:FkbM family methyltransferase
VQYRLSSGQVVHCFNQTDADLVHDEIFVQDVYRRHGVQVGPGDCIVDVGANIGMLLLFLQHLGITATVVAVEPIPEIFEMLRRNAEQCPNLKVHLINVGLSRQEGEATFTFYPRLSCNSALYPDDSHAEQEWHRSYILQRFREHPNRAARFLLQLLPYQLRCWLAERVRRYYYQAQPVRCKLTTLSSVLAAEGVNRIDLLKVDVERSERDVFAGLQESDWPKIRQAVVEIHTAADVPEIEGLFRAHGFRLVIEENVAFSNRFMLYAVR